MRIATILFTYNRSNHTKQVLDSLKQNTILPEKLYIFQDGLKEEEHRKEWLAVNELIHKVDFCSVQIIESKQNKGLAKSIVEGIDFVFKEYDAVVVLEDDCVPAPSFMNFMYQSFEKYNDCKQVYCVSGYAWHINLEQNEYDAYFNGRVSSWGWGTWKDRWMQYAQDNNILNRLSSDRDKSKMLAAWGKDLPTMMEDRLKGRNNSWAIYWALGVIEKGGLCLCPYKTLISNVGLDGSGVHCGADERYFDELNNEIIECFRLPDVISADRRTYEAFSTLHGSRLSMNTANNNKEKVIVYGLGNFFHQYENELSETYNVVALCDRNKTGFYAGIEIIGLYQISKYRDCKIILMLMNVQQALDVARQLNKEFDVFHENILFGLDLYKNCVFSGESITYEPSLGQTVRKPEII